MARFIPDELLPDSEECARDKKEIVDKFGLDDYAVTDIRDAVLLLMEVGLSPLTQTLG